MAGPSWTRRTAITGVFGMAGCGVVGRRPTLLNLASVPAPNADTASTVVETAFDAAVRMTVPVLLEGMGPFPFVVDTGANTSAVADSLAERLSLPMIGTANVHGILGMKPASLTRVRRLAVGDVVSKIDRMPVLPQEQLGADGLVGVDVLKNRRLTLNFRAKRLEIVSSRTGVTATSRLDAQIAEREPAFVAPARFRFGQLVIVDAEVAGAKVIAFLDSGSQVTVGNLALKAAVVRRNPTFAAQLVRTPLISATGQTALAEIAPLPPLRLGGLRISNLTALFADLHIFDIWGLSERPAILVGVDMLRRFNSVEIDYGRRLVTFRPPAAMMRGG